MNARRVMPGVRSLCCMGTHVLLILVLVVSPPALWGQRKSGGAAPRARLIGAVSRVAEGCGCYFRPTDRDEGAERYVFFEDASEGAPVMSIGGREVRLRMVSSTEPPGGVRRRGERFSRRYAAGAVRVRMEFVATSVCPPPYDAECAANGYEVRLTATEGARRQTIKAVGGCGC